MRVLAVIDSIGPGGAERSLVQTLAAMHPGEVQLALFHRFDDAGYEADAHAAGFTLHTIRGRLPGRVLRLRRLRRGLQPDVVHSSLWNADLTARLACLGTDAPLVCSLVNHTYEPSRLVGHGWRRRTAVALIKLVDRISARRVDRFHAVTRSVSLHHQQQLGLPPERIEVAWRGRDADVLRPASTTEREDARTRLGLHGTVLLAIGRLEPQKQHVALVDALPAVLASVPDARCVILGRDGTSSAEVRRRVTELGLDDRVLFAGHHNDVTPFLAAADRFVLPSAIEGIAGAVIEAMLTGVPAVCFDLPGVREISDDGRYARLVPAGRSDSLADAIIDDLEDASGAAERARLARAHAVEAFSMQAAADGLRAIYEHAIELRRR